MPGDSDSSSICIRDPSLDMLNSLSSQLPLSGTTDCSSFYSQQLCNSYDTGGPTTLPVVNINSTLPVVEQNNSTLPDLNMIKMNSSSAASSTVYPCSDCGKVLLSKMQLSNHRRQHATGRRFECHVCGVTYSSKAIFQAHQNIHSKERKFSCDQCAKSFLRRSSLFNHKKIHLLGNSNFKCSVCDIVLQSEDALREHERSHADKNGLNNYEVQCFVCSAILSTNIGLKLHIAQMHSDIVKGKGDKHFLCSICSKKFVSCNHLKQHMKTHTAPKAHHCSQCSYSAQNKEAVRRHVNRIHLKLRKYECNMCNKKFFSQPDRKLHMLRHYKVKPVECNECDRKFYSTRELRRHKWAHTGLKPYRCESCDVGYGYAESLRKHLSTHLSEAIPCGLCNKIYWTEKAASKHRSSHLVEGKIKCSHCDKHYISSRNLQMHLKKANHTVDKLHCRQCLSEFENETDLDTHSRLEEHKENFQCSLCSNVFNSKKQLINHVRSNHKSWKSKSSSEILMQNRMIINERTISVTYDKFIIEIKHETGVNDAEVKHETDVNDAEVKHETDVNDVEVKEEELMGSELNDGLYFLSNENVIIEGVEITDPSFINDALKCKYCNKQFSSAEDYDEHSKHQHRSGFNRRLGAFSSESIEEISIIISETDLKSYEDVCVISITEL